jgi:hypothetical protein
LLSRRSAAPVPTAGVKWAELGNLSQEEVVCLPRRPALAPKM